MVLEILFLILINILLNPVGAAIIHISSRAMHLFLDNHSDKYHCINISSDHLNIIATLVRRQELLSSIKFKSKNGYLNFIFNII